MSNDKINLTIRFLAQVQEYLASTNLVTKDLDKIRDSYLELGKTQQQITAAEVKARQARDSGNKETIKETEKELFALQKIAKTQAENLQKQIDGQVKQLGAQTTKINKEIADEEKKQKNLQETESIRQRLSKNVETALNNQVQANERLQRAEASGNEKRIAYAQKYLANANQQAQKVKQDTDAQIALLDKGLNAFTKAEEKKRHELEKTEREREKAQKSINKIIDPGANNKTNDFFGLGDIEKIATAIANPVAAVGLLIETFNKLSEKAKESIKQIGEKFSEFILGLSEGTISANSFLEGVKGNISALGDEFGLIGTAAAAFNNIGISVAQSVANITVEIANEQKVLRGLNQTLDISTSTLRGYETALSQAGISVTRLPVLLISVNTALEKLKEGSPKVVEGFKAIGLSLKDLEGLNTEEKFQLIFEKIKQLNAVNKEAAANATFAITAQRRAVEPIDLIARNYEKASKSVERFGAVVSQDGDKALIDLGQSFLDLNNLITGVRVQIAEQFAPQLKELADIAVVSLQALKGDENAIAFFRALGKVATLVLNIFKGLILAIPVAFDALRKFERLIPGLSTLTYTLRLLAGSTEENKKAAEEFAEAQKKEKEALHATELTAKQLKETLNKLEEQTKTNTKNTIAESEERINQIEKEEAIGKKSVIDAGEEILLEKEKLSQKLIAIEEGRIAALEAVGINDVHVLEKIEKAKAELAKLRTDREEIELQQKKQNQKELSQELISQAKIEANELQAIAKEAQTNIIENENEGLINHEEAARQRAEITKNQIEFEIQQYKNLLEDDRLTNDVRRRIREDLSKLEQELGQAGLVASKDINKAKKLDDKETADAKKKGIQDAIKELENSANTLKASDKAFNDQQKNNIDDVVDKFKKGELDKQTAFRRTIQIQLDGISFSIATQLALLDNLAKEQQKLKTDKQDTTKVDDDIIVANQKIADLQRIQVELQDALKGKVDGTSEAVNKLASAFGNVSTSIQKVKSGEEAINDAVEHLGDRANSVADKLKGGLTSVGESAEISALSVEDLQERIDELANHIKFIQEKVAIGNKDALINPSLAVIDALNAEIIKRTQGAALEKAAEEARIAEEKARETAQKLQEINQERINDLIEAERDFEEKKQKLKEDTEKENEEFVTREFERNTKLNEDKLKETEQFNEKEKEIKDKAAEQDLERERKAKEDRKKLALDTADNINDIERDLLVEQKKIRDEIDQAKKDKQDPAAIKALQDKLAGVTSKGQEKISREERKKLELDNLAKENLSEEEFNAKRDAIERKFRLEEEAAAQRANFQGENDKKELAALNAKIKEQEERDKQRLADELKRIEEAAQRKKDQEEKERAERQKAYDNKLKDLQDSFDKERDEAQKAHDERLDDIKEQQKEIKDEFIATQNEINQNAVESAAQIGLTGKAIQDAFGLGDEAAKKYLETLGKINEAQAGIQQTGGFGSSASSGDGSTSSGIGNSGGSSGSSGGSVFGGGSSGSSTSGSSSSGSSSSSSSGGSGSSGQSGSSSGSSSSSGGSGKNEAKKERAEAIDNLPKTAKSSSEYRSNANKIFDAHAAFIKDRKRNYSIFVKYFEAFRFLTVDYFKQNEVFVDPKNANSFGLPFGILDFAQKPLEFADQKEAKSGFNKVIDTVIAFVENSKKDTSKGADKAGDIGSKGGSVSTPGLSSDSNSSGGIKGDTATSAVEPGSIEPPKEAKDTRFDPKAENIGEGAEAAGAVLSGPNFGGSTAPTAEEALAGQGSSERIQQTNTIEKGIDFSGASFNFNIEASQSAMNTAFKQMLKEVLESGELENVLTEKSDKAFSNNMLGRNSSNAVKL